MSAMASSHMQRSPSILYMYIHVSIPIFSLCVYSMISILSSKNEMHIFQFSLQNGLCRTNCFTIHVPPVLGSKFSSGEALKVYRVRSSVDGFSPELQQGDESLEIMGTSFGFYVHLSNYLYTISIYIYIYIISYTYDMMTYAQTAYMYLDVLRKI